MSAIAVTGAAGAVGLRVVRQLAADPAVTRVVAIDRHSVDAPWPGVELAKADLAKRYEWSRAGSNSPDPDPGLLEALAGIDSIVHLAERRLRPGDLTNGQHADEAMLHAALGLAGQVDCRHVVLLSSATVFGAHHDNPIPLTEAEPARPNADLEFAVAKQAGEEIGRAWTAVGSGRSSAILRPTTTLSERDTGWLAKAIRAATTVRLDQDDPPVQFLHHDDLASAITFVAKRRLDGLYNVAPDGWIGPEAFRELVGGVQFRLPSAVNDRLSDARRRLGVRPTPAGIEPYVQHPWVVANDRLRAEGWTPAFSNEEAYVLGTPPPPWSVSAQRRQELALGASGLAVAGAAALTARVLRRLSS
ncbi:MAG: nucleoside-diphosphate-sugar epimerase [Acidimicrobiales bacterium]|jgi:nucleoside-diphosphate-sugar epimerase